MKEKLKFEVTNYQVSLWPLCMLGEMLFYYFHKLLGQNYDGEMIGEWKDKTNRWALDIDDHTKISKIALPKVENDPSWAWKTAGKIPKVCTKLLNFTDKVFKMDFSKKTDKQLLKIYMDYRDEFINMYIYSWFPNALEGMDGFFTKKLEKYLKDKLKVLGKVDQVGRYLSVLITPLKDSTRQKEEKEFLKILLETKGQRKMFDKKIDKHYKKYCWLPFDYDGPAWDRDYFIDIARSLTEQKIDIQKELDKMKDEREELKDLQEKFSKEIGLEKDKKYSYLFDLGRELMYLKDYRKDALFKSYYHMDKLIREIGKRLGLSSIQVKYILPQEMEDALVNKKYNADELNSRIKYTVLVYEEDGIKIYVGKKAHDIIDQRVEEEKVPLDIKELQGESAYLGKAKGKVKLVFEIKDISKMEEGDILVSVATNPNLIPAMKKAAAIITDKGGITSHAAIISRELKTPCVTGTKIATQVLRDGDLVEVDAEKGVVKKYDV